MAEKQKPFALDPSGKLVKSIPEDNSNKPFAIDSSGRLVKASPTKEQEFVGPRRPIEPIAPVVEAPVVRREIQPVVVNKEQLRTNVQKTFDKFGAGAGANRAFIEGVSKLAGRRATEEEISQGGTLAEVIERFGVGGQLTGFGVIKPEPKITPTITPTRTITPTITEPTVTAPAPVTTTDLISKGFDELISQIKQGIPAEADVVGASERLTEAQTKVNDIMGQIQTKGVLDLTELKNIGDRPIANVFIRNQQAAFSDEQKLDNMLLEVRYNNALVEEQIASGNFNRASEINSEIADDNMRIAQIQLQKLQAQGVLDERQAERANTQLVFERDLALEGFTEISKTQAGELDTDRVFVDPISGKSYLKPAEKTAEELELDRIDLLSQKLGIEKQMLENALIGEDKFQATVTTSEGIFRITYDENSNEINRSRIGDSPAGTKAPSSTQFQAATFANRIEQSDAILKELTSVGTGVGTAIGFTHLPEITKTEDRKRFEQAERNLINAILRRESGAAIADSEFVSARLQYIPQPGDGKATLDQKQANRNTVMRGLQLEAGSALTGSALSGEVTDTGSTEDLYN